VGWWRQVRLGLRPHAPVVEQRAIVRCGRHVTGHRLQVIQRRIDRSPSAVKRFVQTGEPGVLHQAFFDGTVRLVVPLAFDKRGPVGATTGRRIGELNEVVFSETDWANAVGARRLVEHEVAAAGAGIAVGWRLGHGHAARPLPDACPTGTPRRAACPC